MSKRNLSHVVQENLLISLVDAFSFPRKEIHKNIQKENTIGS